MLFQEDESKQTTAASYDEGSYRQHDREDAYRHRDDDKDSYHHRDEGHYEKQYKDLHDIIKESERSPNYPSASYPSYPPPGKCPKWVSARCRCLCSLHAFEDLQAVFAE